MAVSRLLKCTGWDPQLRAPGGPGRPEYPKIAPNWLILVPLAPLTVGPILAQFLIMKQTRNCHMYLDYFYSGWHCLPSPT